MESDRLDIVLVVLEGTRADHLGCYGYERETTPFLDRVAAEGVRFTHAFTTAPSALAAHASLLTGTFAAVHGATEESGALVGPLPLLPARLKTGGYRTAAFCFDPAVSPESGFGRGFDRFHTRSGSGYLTGRAADYARRARDRVLGRADAGARRTNELVRDWVAADAAPFFAYVVYREPARPRTTPAPYDRMFAAQERAPGVTDAAADATAAYDHALRYVDLRVRELAEALAANGRWERTLLIVTATHGTHLGAANGAPPMSDGILRVPLLVRGPSCIPRGFVVDAFAQSVDVAPTILSLAGLAVLEGQGRVLLGAEGVTAGPDAVVVEAFRTAGGTAGVRRKALRTRREKFVWQSDEANGLFDLIRDPSEQHNLIATETERGDRLRRRLFDWLASSERWAESSGIAAANGAGEPAAERRGARE
jgi:arylsulfatase